MKMKLMHLIFNMSTVYSRAKDEEVSHGRQSDRQTDSTHSSLHSIMRSREKLKKSNI